MRNLHTCLLHSLHLGLHLSHLGHLLGLEVVGLHVVVVTPESGGDVTSTGEGIDATDNSLGVMVVAYWCVSSWCMGRWGMVSWCSVGAWVKGGI